MQVHLASRFQIECSPLHRGSSSGTALGGNHRKDGLMTNARQLVIEAKCSKCKRETKTQHNHPTTCLASSQPVTRPPTRSYFAANAFVSRQFRCHKDKIQGKQIHCTMQQGLTFLEGGVFHGQNGSQKFCFYNCYDICFYNVCEKHGKYGKIASKV